jgi:hypothetical protein
MCCLHSGRSAFVFAADPSFSVIKAYDSAFNIPVIGAAFANRISYVISPELDFTDFMPRSRALL